jgi:hypothetical protein
MRSLVIGAVALGMLTSSSSSYAEPPPPLADLAGREPVVADLVPRPLLPLRGGGPGRATVSFALALAQRPERRDITGSLVVSVPTSRFVAPTKAKVASPLDKSATEDGGSADRPDDDQAPDVLARDPREQPVILPLIRPRDARAAISAAQRVAGTVPADERLDDLATRARWSALLPQLRLRATRLIDESNSLSPTSYDANRITSSGGASLWLEARTTWSLDRLLFASEEVPIERLRQKQHDDRAEASRRVLDLLFRWQRAAYAVSDPQAHPDQCPSAWLKEQQLAAALDVKTGGWLTRWRNERGQEPIGCADWEAVDLR